jgi:hypothetical protein
MGGHGDVHNASTLMDEDEEHEQESTRCRRDDEEIGCRDLLGMICQERPPRLGRRSGAPAHVLRDGRLRDVEAQFQQLAVNPRRAPERIRLRHGPN